MSLVSILDVQSRLLDRALTSEQGDVVAVWIEDLESEIRFRIPDLNTLFVDDVDFANTLRRVVSASIKRVLDNPRGLRQFTESIDDYSRTETIDSASSTGALMLTDDEWNAILPGTSGDAFTISPYFFPGA